jgi:DNA-binding transcriptional regulator YdaS (Cro superfamily)
MKLADWLRIHDLTDAAFAARISVSRETVRLLRTGQRAGAVVGCKLAHGATESELAARIAAATGGRVTAADLRAAYKPRKET